MAEYNDFLILNIFDGYLIIRNVAEHICGLIYIHDFNMRVLLKLFAILLYLIIMPRCNDNDKCVSIKK